MSLFEQYMATEIHDGVHEALSLRLLLKDIASHISVKHTHFGHTHEHSHSHGTLAIQRFFGFLADHRPHRSRAKSSGDGAQLMQSQSGYQIERPEALNEGDTVSQI